MSLTHYDVETPVFMPVGTQGTVKGLLPDQLEELDCQIILGNTYHLGVKPGSELLKKAGGLHKFMSWNRAILTDTGGFQMVSLLNLAQVTEDGVKFRSPYGATDCILTPEECIKIQNATGADVIMQLDDVVKTTLTGTRVKESVYRTSRWLERCLSAHERPHDQALFPVCQGDINEKLRLISTQMHVEKNLPGFAIGGLCGNEFKSEFWKMVFLSTNVLPKNKPRYLMGVGFALEMVVCCALGIDMYDCVFPIRTARFGCALVSSGQLNLKLAKYKFDFQPIDEKCECSTCKRYTRAYLHSVVTLETNACHLLSIHNLCFQMTLMKLVRKSIKEQKFPQFVREFVGKVFVDKPCPVWAINALKAVNITLNPE